LGDPSHVIYSDDYANTWQLVEGDWSTHHAGALWEFPDGRLFAVRNLPGQAKLYGGFVSGLALKSTIPFPARVNPRAIAFDWTDATAVVCAASGQSVMVVLAPRPYSSWTDVTANHGTSGGVKSVAIL
jgi:hypothetical protein